MLRECRRVLTRGGRIAGYVIHTPEGLDQAAEIQAADLGPSDVNAPASPQQLTRQAGLRVSLAEDVTAGFRIACSALLRARDEHAEQIRGEEGDEVFEAERCRKRNMLKGVDKGLLRRSLIVAVKP